MFRGVRASCLRLRGLEEANALGVPYAASSILLPSSDAAAPSAGGGGAVMAKLNSLTLDDFKRIAERANRIGEEAKKAGVQFAYHNHTHEFRDLGAGKTGYAVLLAETDPALVQMEGDCGWMVTAGANPVEFFQRYPKRYRVIHIKDFPAGRRSRRQWAVRMRHTQRSLAGGTLTTSRFSLRRSVRVWSTSLSSRIRRWLA